MAINLDKSHLWKSDINRSVDFYNTWFVDFAPEAFRKVRAEKTEDVDQAFLETNYLTNISPEVLEQNPEVLTILGMSTCPPIACDRLIRLAQVPKSLVEDMENKDNPHIPLQIKKTKLKLNLQKITDILIRLLDQNIFTWIPEKRSPTDEEISRASTIVADRLWRTYGSHY